MRRLIAVLCRHRHRIAVRAGLRGRAKDWALGSLALSFAALVTPHAEAVEAMPVPVAVLPIKLLDTSGEPTDQTLQHTDRLQRLAEDLTLDLTRTGWYRARLLPAKRLLKECPAGEAPCLLQAARAGGAELIFIGVVHKSSTLILQLWARLVDARTGRDVFSRDLNFRGDTDEAWRRAEGFLVAQIREAAVTGPEGAPGHQR